MLYIVGIIRRFRGDFFERITHLMSDFSQGTCAEVGSMFLGVWVSGKKNAKKDKDRPRCGCRQCEPKGGRCREPITESKTSGSPV